MENIAVIGAGTMGNGIAHVFAQKGFKVQLIDAQATALEKAIATIKKNLDRQIYKQLNPTIQNKLYTNVKHCTQLHTTTQHFRHTNNQTLHFFYNSTQLYTALHYDTCTNKHTYTTLHDFTQL